MQQNNMYNEKTFFNSLKKKLINNMKILFQI